MKKEIDNYMTPAEAAHRWGKNTDTVKNKLKPSLKKEQIERMEKEGLIKGYKDDKGANKSWIIGVKAMEEWFGKLK